MVPFVSRAKQLSQVLELLLSVADDLGIRTDRELAGIIGVSPESVGNWRSGSVRVAHLLLRKL